MTEQITIKNLDHLGLIAGIIDEIDIENIVNSLIKTDQREKISAGTIVKAIILNGLGYLSKPLYLFPEFFRDKPVEKLLGNGIKAEEINDDKIGRVMNELYQVSGDKLWTQIGLNMIKLFEINLTKKKWKYHKLTEIKCQDKMEKYELKYEENKEIIELEKTKCGRFILATKIMDNKELVGEEMLCQYKNQQSCERGFRFLKDPLLLTKSVEVMGMLMGLCLKEMILAYQQLEKLTPLNENYIFNEIVCSYLFRGDNG